MSLSIPYRYDKFENRELRSGKGVSGKDATARIKINKLLETPANPLFSARDF